MKEGSELVDQNRKIRMMIPGPVEVHPDVLKAMGSAVEPHYGDVWVEKNRQVLEILKEIFNTNGDVFLMVGSGTCAIDAAFGSTLQTGERILIGNNGYFGDRLVSIAQHNGLDVVETKAEWGQELDPEAIKRILQRDPSIKAVAVVHGETSTTVLNPIREIGPIVREEGRLFIVDAVSSLGGVPFEMDAWCIDVCASATQKCLGSPPGLGPIALNERAWKSIDRLKIGEHGWYSDLRIWRQYAQEWGDWHPSPVTMATNNVNALLVSLTQLKNEGIPVRMERYRQLAVQLREGMRKAGMPPFTSDEKLNPVLTAGYAPSGVDSAEIVHFLLREYAIQISGGLGALKSTIFRIGHMSPIMTKEDIALVCEALMAFHQ
ncbi:MAG: pyridoxal-phosphate-dependent aminotransferase family protein [Anaerolineaceae bacterium]